MVAAEDPHPASPRGEGRERQKKVENLCDDLLNVPTWVCKLKFSIADGVPCGGG